MGDGSYVDAVALGLLAVFGGCLIGAFINRDPDDRFGTVCTTVALSVAFATIGAIAVWPTP